MSYKQDIINDLAIEIKKQGFRVFLSKKGAYGFFTDNEGKKVICFSLTIGPVTFSGNYKTDKPSQTGTGWRITDDIPKDFSEVYNAHAPRWATKNSNWKYTTLRQHLKSYQWSSRYKEV